MRAIGLAGLLLLVLAGCGKDTIPVVACPDLTQGCRFSIADQAVQAEAKGPISTFRPFDLTIRTAPAAQMTVQFSMLGMEMGPGRYRLQQSSPGIWVGKIMLPVCIQGRRDWQMLVDMDGKQVLVPFSSS
ncbi:hypothetical protein HNQ59_000637 [Chitinivorax tropicus]|uniref:YtkA-like domain-containing protein n=1 Tax=Chitinivorax tropicus TaxID=714531 RepID=A0A840MME5_9PROT|nr:hypothetical protein [Chitinivorax tropicus]MBB5017373.1 hypothetical protein [Chitinivorax tropicus]